MCFAGSESPSPPNAARTRSRLSPTALSARPTTVKKDRARGHLHLDVDAPGLNAVEGDGDHACNHEALPTYPQMLGEPKGAGIISFANPAERLI